MLTPDSLKALQRTLADEELDGWLLFDFHGVNPIAGGMLLVHGFKAELIAAEPDVHQPVARHAVTGELDRRQLLTGE